MLLWRRFVASLEVGVSDLGANAARIYRILDELKKIDA